MSILNQYKNQLETLNVALPFMEGREKTECKEFAIKSGSQTLHINNIGFMELPDDNGVLQEVGVITVKEDDKSFIFVGQAVTDTLKKICEMVGDDIDELIKETIPFHFEVKKSKNKREYVSIKLDLN